jgi:3-hydroxybutyryl-CoA dehydratase
MPEFEVGATASLAKTITDDDVRMFARATGDLNPLHLDEEYAAKSRFGRRVAHGMLSAGMISAVLGTELPGPGTIYLGQTLKFLAPVYLGDSITATVTLAEYNREKGRMTFQTMCTNQDGAEVVSGEAQVLYRP